MNQGLKRRQIEEKEALHNITISVPFFISNSPTKLVSINRDNHLTRGLPQQKKLNFTGTQFPITKIVSFPSVSEAEEFYKAYQEMAKNQPQLKMWCQYCKDLSGMEGILFQEGKIYVMHFENKELRDFLNGVSQLLAVDGAAAQESMHRHENSLFRVMEEDTISLEQLYIRWRVYSYLQGDGDKKYPTYPFRMIDQGQEWYPPVPSSIPRTQLNFVQRRHLHNLLFNLTRKKKSIEQAMVFCIFNLNCIVEIVAILALQIFQKLKEDFIKYFYLISDILYNTTSQNYRKLFARIIPFAVYFYAKALKQSLITGAKDVEMRSRGQLKALIQIWEIKFIFEENYTKGLMFLLNYFEKDNKHIANRVHEKLKIIGGIEDQRESEMELEKLCFDNGIPLIQTQKEENMRIINEYLYYSEGASLEIIEPQATVTDDGEPLSDKDLLKIKNKQVKVVCCEGLSVNMILQKNWQTKGTKGNISNSIDES